MLYLSNTASTVLPQSNPATIGLLITSVEVEAEAEIRELTPEEAKALDLEIIKYRTNLRKYAFGLTRRHDRADDLLQDTLLRAFTKKHLWRPDSDLRAWLFTIMHNVYASSMKKASREAAEIGGEDLVELIPDHRTDPAAGLMLQDVLQSLDKLPSDQMRVISLVGYHGLSYEQAADREGIFVGTIRSRLSRGREELKKILEGSDIDVQSQELINEWGKARVDRYVYIKTEEGSDQYDINDTRRYDDATRTVISSRDGDKDE